jgi:hypothetical protein
LSFQNNRSNNQFRILFFGLAEKQQIHFRILFGVRYTLESYCKIAFPFEKMNLCFVGVLKSDEGLGDGTPSVLDEN